MVWRETGIVDERVSFVAACLEDEETMSAVCAAYGISRRTGYKWLKRYRAEGPSGLLDLPRTPLHHGRATSLDVVERIVAVKEAHRRRTSTLRFFRRPPTPSTAMGMSGKALAMPVRSTMAASKPIRITPVALPWPSTTALVASVVETDTMAMFAEL